VNVSHVVRNLAPIGVITDPEISQWRVLLDFEHVSGDHFMTFIDSATAPGLIFKEARPAEFVVGSDGISKKFGIAAEPSMGIDKKIWFERT